MSKDWELDWGKYPSLENINPDPNITTFIIGFRSHEKLDITREPIENWFKNNDFEIKPDFSEYQTVYKSKKNNTQKLIIHKTLFKAISIRCTNGAYLNDFRKFLRTRYDYQLLVIGEIKHGHHYLIPSSMSEKVYSVCGNLKENDSLPIKIYEYYKERDLIGKALLYYENFANQDCTPNIARAYV